MAFSRYYQVTNQLVAEYMCDQYNIIKNGADVDSSESQSFVMYAGADGLQYCVEDSNLKYTKFSDEAGVNYLYPRLSTINGVKGKLSTDDEEPFAGTYSVRYVVPHETNYSSTTLTRDCMQVIEDAEHRAVRTYDNYHDRIRIYILTGYVLNSLAGISVKVKARVTNVKQGNQYKRVGDYLTMLDWFMPKEDLRVNAQPLASPLYLNSKFYDRYIDIYFQSPYACALNGNDVDYVYDDGDAGIWRGVIDRSSPVIVQFATVSPEHLTNVIVNGNDTASLFSLDPAREFAVSMSSNSRFFGVRLYEDVENGVIMYYPTYGDPESGNGVAQPFDTNMMLQVETGAIPMVDLAEFDMLNDGMDDFLDEYGSEMYKWIIINELSVTYTYSWNFSGKDVETKTDYLTNTIDYTGKSDAEHGPFWKSMLVPAIESRANRTCDSVVVKYTCHLYNRMNGIDIVRTATMASNNPEAKFMKKYRQINTDAVTQYKVVNKINKLQMQPQLSTGGVQEKLVRSYYDATDVIVKDVESGQMYTMGKMTLCLKHSSSNYMIRVYSVNSDNVRVPYDLTGIEQYKLVFPSVNGGKVEVYPNMDSESNKLGIGSLVFYISEQRVKEIMGVPASERYFALVAEPAADTALETTVYEGKVDYYV